MMTVLAAAQDPNVSNAAFEGGAAGGAFAALMAAGIALVIGCIGVMILVKILFLWLTYDAAKVASPEHRSMDPALVWLLLIPLFNLFWNFRALPAVSDSLAATLKDKGQDGDDAGRSVAITYSWLLVVIFAMDMVGRVSGARTQAGELVVILFLLIAFICFIIYLCKIRSAKSRILAAG